jgi:hypothetical protein
MISSGFATIRAEAKLSVPFNKGEDGPVGTGDAI